MISIALLVITCALLVLSFVGGEFPFEQSVQHIPTAVTILVLGVAAHRRWLTLRSLVAIVLFLWLHILGARYIYSYVPYDDWSNEMLGRSVSSFFDWRRNHFDRLVHLAAGVLFVVPAYDVAMQWGQLRPAWAAAFAFSCIGLLSAGYEISEWIIGIAMAPDFAEAYNGQQGDVWDPQKDMALALLGACVMSSLLWSRSAGIAARLQTVR